jgi:hypothetical protein
VGLFGGNSAELDGFIASDHAVHVNVVAACFD